MWSSRGAMRWKTSGATCASVSMQVSMPSSCRRTSSSSQKSGQVSASPPESVTPPPESS